MTTASAAEIFEGAGADYSITVDDMYDLLIAHIEAQQPCFFWGPPGVGKSYASRAVAELLNMEYIDIRALMLDPVDLRGIPWRDENGRTRWAPPNFLPPTDSEKTYLINLEELSAAPQMVQVALYQLVLDRACGEYLLPPGATIIACGNRESDRGVAHRMPTPLANRFIHYEVKVDPTGWMRWAARNGVAPEVLFFIQFRSELLHRFNPNAKDNAFATPRSWEFVSNMMQSQEASEKPLPDNAVRSMYRGAVGEEAAVAFLAFLDVWKQLPHPDTILNDPANAPIPTDVSAVLALCGALYKKADEFNMDQIVTFAGRLREEIGHFLVGSCVEANANTQYTRAWVNWTVEHN